MEKLDFLKNSNDKVIGLAFSGGLDSTYLLKLLLRESKYKVLAVYILTKDKETQAQYVSAEKIINALKKTERHFEFIVVELPQALTPKGPSWAQSMIAYYVFGQMAQYRNLDFVVTGIDKDEDAELPRWAEMCGHIMECAAWGIRYTNDNKIPKYIDWAMSDRFISRKEEIKYIGELSKLVWFCLNPNEDKTSCGVCRKCKIMLPLIK